MKSTGTARWEGAAGKVSAATGLFKDALYTGKARFEGGAPGTTPEELTPLRSGCFSMSYNVGSRATHHRARSIEPRVV